MDIFNEQLVTRKKSSVEKMYKYGIIALAAMLIFILLVFVTLPLVGRFYAFLMFIPLFGCLGVYFLAKKLYGALDIEFEDALTNGQFDVDKIVNRTDRTRLVSFDCADIEKFGKYTSDIKTDGYKTRIIAANADSENLYYFTVKTTKTGNTILIIEPNEKMLEGIKLCIPRQIYFDVFGRN